MGKRQAEMVTDAVAAAPLLHFAADLFLSVELSRCVRPLPSTLRHSKSDATRRRFLARVLSSLLLLLLLEEDRTDIARGRSRMARKDR